MENNKNENGFTYTYSAEEQAEIKRIRDKYTPRVELEDKMTRLRRLDASVTKAAETVALVMGIIGTLTLGFGMSLIMTELAAFLGLTGNAVMIVGIAVGTTGGVIASLAYPVYNAIVKARRKALAPEIISLTDELMK